MRNTISSAASSAGTAAVVFSEGFDGTTGFPPAGWTAVNADGGGTTGPWFQGNESIFPAQFGEGYAAANYQGANDFLIDEWLISPLIPSAGPGDTLVLWNRSPDGSFYADSLQVLLSGGDTALGSFTILVDYFQTSTYGWQERRYPLAAHIGPGSDIRIAFRYYITDGGISGMNSDYAGLDNVQLRRAAYPADIAPVSLDDPAPGTKALVDLEISPLATFENAGIEVQRAIPVRLAVSAPTGEKIERTQVIDSLLPGENVQVAFAGFTPAATGTYIYHVIAALEDDDNRANDTLRVARAAGTLVSGTITVGPGGSVSTLREAFDTLNHNILSGDVVLELLGGDYDEPPLSLGPLDYASSVTGVLLRAAPGAVSTVHVTSTSSDPFGIALSGVSRVTLDGSDGSDPNPGITLFAEGPYGTVGVLIEATAASGADDNTVKDLAIRNGADSLTPSGAYYGILVTGAGPDVPGYGNHITGCDVTRHGSTGIGAQWQEEFRIDRTTIRDWTQRAGAAELCGIWLSEGVDGAVLSANVVRSIVSHAGGSGVSGIELGTGSSWGTRVENCMISGVLAAGQGMAPNDSRGIFASSMFNEHDTLAFNSIHLFGTDSSISGSSRTAAVEIAGGPGTVLLNNILSNEVVIAGDGPENRSYGVFLAALPDGFVSDHNDFHTPGPGGAAGHHDLALTTLEEWGLSFDPAQDEASITEDPLFLSALDLHIRTDETSPVNDGGIPVAGIVTDVDGASRNPTTPDIGADEHTPGGMSLRISYAAGWNIVALPFGVTDPRSSAHFGGAVSPAYAFGGSGYAVVETLEIGNGYWLKFGTSSLNDIGGTPVPEDTVVLRKGWNLVGSLSFPVSVYDVITEPAGLLTTRFFGYEGGYREATVIEAGKGYWVKAGDDGILILRIAGR